jgi:hypothetical protein
MKFTTALRTATFLTATALAGQTAPEDPFLLWMDGIAQSQLQAREEAISKIHTIAGAEKRKQVVRQRILEALGGLPDYGGPLDARVTGRLQADGYVIEKVIYQSLPGYFVTANLYRPDRPGRYPGVLLQAGHTQEGKAEPQMLAANLALKGFVALAFDPVGEGEREQSYDPQLRAPAAGWSVNEHIHAGAQSALAGESVARYFIWDAKRSIDYLAGRPEVDPQRIGAAGCSGGGALTTFIGALDTRLKAVIPACFPVSYRVLFTGDVPHSEMMLPEELARGLDTADFVELSAPAPWLIEATEQDFFPPAGAKLVYDEARRWYGLYGAEDRVALFIGPGPHGTPLVSREAIYRWLIRWLNGGNGDPREQPVHLFANHDLLVTKTGHVDEEAGSRKLYELIADDFRRKQKPGSRAELQSELRRWNIPTDGSAPAIRILSETEGSSYRIQQVRIGSEPGIELTGELLIPRSEGPKKAVVLVSGEPSGRLGEMFAGAGHLVLRLEPRNSPSGDRRRPYLGDWLTNTRADLIGMSLPAMRAHDILRGVDLLAHRADVDPDSIRAAAQGVEGVWLLLAAAADTRIRKIWLDGTPHRFAGALENTMNTELSDAVIPGFALRWELTDLVQAMEDRPVLWTDPADWMGRIVAAGPRYRYRYVPGDMTDRSDAQDRAFADELMK